MHLFTIAATPQIRWGSLIDMSSIRIVKEPVTFNSDADGPGFYDRLL